MARKVLLWGDDTDLFAIVLHRLSKIPQEERPSISFFRSSSRSTIELTSLSKQINAETLALILPIHSFSGCDTKSYFYKFSKKRVFKRLQLHKNLTEAYSWLMTFIDPDAPHHDLFDDGKQLILTMYNVTSKRCSTLEELRLR